MRARPPTPALLAALLFAAAASSCGPPLVVLRPGDPAPPFSLQDLGSGTVSLESLRGKIVFVRFWADWCKSCRTEMPMIERKYQLLRGAGFEVVALNVRQGRETAARFAREIGITYPVLLDADGSTAEAYGVIGLPTTFLVDRDGRIREEILGDMNWESLSELLDPLFQGPPAESAPAGGAAAPPGEGAP